MFVIGTAGHVDHGKSALVEALTGIDPDRLREEKTRGMTIDLGFAWLTLPSGREVSIVDVPGHERFIKNMLAGAGGVDLALLVVAADDGVMPQTREHLAILDLLDVRRGVVALTKTDLADDDWLAMVEADARDLLAGTALAQAPIVRCSAVTRTGLAELLGALDDGVAALPPKRDIGRPRLPIDRVFTMQGFGTVVTGTLIDGALRVGDEVAITPGGTRGRVRGLQSHRASVERALPGTRTAVNITGVAREDVRRGMVLAHAGTLQASATLDVRVRALEGVSGRVRHGATLMFHAGSDETPARVRLVGGGAVEPGREAWAQLRLSAPVAALRGDRFVLRTPEETIAGGIILDTSPKSRRRVDASDFERSSALLAAAPREAVLEAAGRRPFSAPAEIAQAAALDAAAVSDTIAALVSEGALVRLGSGADESYATSARMAAAADEAASALSEHHRRHHLTAGMPLQEFRARLGLPAGATAALDSAGTITVRNGVVALPGFEPAPTPQEDALIDAYVASLGDGARTQPLPEELLAYAVQHGRIVDAGNGVVFSGDVFGAMRARIEAHIASHGPITLATARDVIGTGRKQAQALLEELDRRGVTRRTGETRVLRRAQIGVEGHESSAET